MNIYIDKHGDNDDMLSYLKKEKMPRATSRRTIDARHRANVITETACFTFPRASSSPNISVCKTETQIAFYVYKYFSSAIRNVKKK